VLVGSTKGSRNAAGGPVCRAVGAEFDGVTAFGLDFGRIGVGGPAEQRAEGKVLDNREFGQYFCVIHLDHALSMLAVVRQ
jgi:hypothetical protein